VRFSRTQGRGKHDEGKGCGEVETWEGGENVVGCGEVQFSRTQGRKNAARPMQERKKGWEKGVGAAKINVQISCHTLDIVGRHLCTSPICCCNSKVCCVVSL